MEHTQSIIINIGDYCCLVHCYIYCMGIAPSTKEYFKITYDALKAGVNKSGIGADCYVENPSRFLEWLTGKSYTVEKRAIATLKTIKAPAPVRFAYGSTSHFVVVENGQIVFDPYENSKTVALGRPLDARIITLK